MFTLLAAVALAAAPSHPVTVVGALGGAAGVPAVDAAPGSFGGFGALHAAWHPGRFGVEFVGREGMHGGDLRSIGSLALGGRWAPPRGPYLRLGLLHHHETPVDVLRDQPVLSVLGAAEGIRHRTGAEVAVGLDLDIPERVLGDRLGFVVDLSVAAFPDPRGPAVYVVLEQGWSLDLGPDRGLDASDSVR